MIKILHSLNINKKYKTIIRSISNEQRFNQLIVITILATFVRKRKKKERHKGKRKETVRYYKTYALLGQIRPS